MQTEEGQKNEQQENNQQENDQQIKKENFKNTSAPAKRGRKPKTPKEDQAPEYNSPNTDDRPVAVKENNEANKSVPIY